MIKDHPFQGAALRGKLSQNAPLKKLNWFRTQATADWLYQPADLDDLCDLLAAKPADMPHMTIGVGSNLLIRAGGIEGLVITLGRDFAYIKVQDDIMTVGAAAMDAHVAKAAQQAGIAGMEFLIGVPGTIGGALAMNAGCYGRDMSNIFIDALAVTSCGHRVTLTPGDVAYGYRSTKIDPTLILIEARLKGQHAQPQQITALMDQIMTERSAAQPLGTRTGGSTFKNTDGGRAWQLIDAAGLRGYRIGDAQLSPKHCNFIVNLGGASAADIEAVGEVAQAKVLAHSGVVLEWEIRRVGRRKTETGT